MLASWDPCTFLNLQTLRVLRLNCSQSLQDVVDVHEIQEDLLVRRGTDTQAGAAKTMLKNSNATVDPDSAAEGMSPTATLEPVPEVNEEKLAAVLSDAAGSESQDVHGTDCAGPPTLLSQLPSGEDFPSRQGSMPRTDGENEDSLQRSPSRMVLLQSNPGLAKLADEVPSDAVPIENFEDVSNDNWGLDMLVRVGESWTPNLLEMTACVLNNRPHYTPSRASVHACTAAARNHLCVSCSFASGTCARCTSV